RRSILKTISPVIHVHRFRLGIEIDYLISDFAAAVTRFFHSAEWCMRIAADARAVDMDYACFGLLGKSEYCGHVPSEYRSSQAISNAVGNRDRFLQVSRSYTRQNRAEH